MPGIVQDLCRDESGGTTGVFEERGALVADVAGGTAILAGTGQCRANPAVATHRRRSETAVTDVPAQTRSGRHDQWRLSGYAAARQTGTITIQLFSPNRALNSSPMASAL